MISFSQSTIPLVSSLTPYLSILVIFMVCIILYIKQAKPSYRLLWPSTSPSYDSPLTATPPSPMPSILSNKDISNAVAKESEPNSQVSSRSHTPSRSLSTATHTISPISNTNPSSHVVPIPTTESINSTILGSPSIPQGHMTLPSHPNSATTTAPLQPCSSLCSCFDQSISNPFNSESTASLQPVSETPPVSCDRLSSSSHSVVSSTTQPINASCKCINNTTQCCKQSSSVATAQLSNLTHIHAPTSQVANTENYTEFRSSDDPEYIDYSLVKTQARRRPVRPLDEACCGEGCMRCVFDVYEDNLARWQVRRDKAVQDQVDIHNNK